MKEIGEIKQKVLRNFVSRCLPRLVFKIDIDGESEQKIETIRQDLEKDNSLNLVIYGNHTNIIDPLFPGFIISRVDKRTSRTIIAPMSYSNTEEKPENKRTRQMVRIIENCGVEAHRVIQKYQINNPDYGYTSTDAHRVNMPFLLRMRQINKEKKPACMVVFPEAHRTNGKLIEGDESMYLAGSVLAPVLFVPLGIRYENKKHPIGRKKVFLTVGDSYLQETRIDLKMNYENLMVRLAKTLPEDMRGFYKDLADLPEVRG